MTARKPVVDEPLISLTEVANRLGVPVKTFRSWREHHRAPCRVDTEKLAASPLWRGSS